MAGLYKGGGQLHPILPSRLTAWVLVNGQISQHMTKPGPQAPRPMQGVMEGRAAHSKTQSHWLPNGNKIL